MAGSEEKHKTTTPEVLTTTEESALRLAVEWVFPKAQRLKIAGSVTLGRGEECDFSLSGERSSRLHAKLRWDGPVLVLEDLGSRNGTYVNGKRCERGPVTASDVLRLGEWVGVVVPVIEPHVPFGALAPGLLGSARLANVLAPLRRIAPSDLPVIIEGATGTGKEVVARALHGWSRRSGPLLAVNCAALPEPMAEAELFGYRKGAFTGADRASPGYFRSARGGTLLLDEFTELPLTLQAKLLRVLECGEVIPLGESTPTPVEVRVVVAAQQSVAQAAASGYVRPDLHARLNGLTVQLPSLAERREDIVPLFNALLRDAGSGQELESRLAEQLSRYDWPLNVREMVLMVRRLVQLHAQDPILKRSHLPEMLAALRGNRESAPEILAVPREDHEGERKRETPSELPAARSQRELEAERLQRDQSEAESLRAMLAQCEGNVSRAAARLGISRQRAYRLIHRSGLVLAEVTQRVPDRGLPDRGLPDRGLPGRGSPGREPGKL